MAGAREVWFTAPGQVEVRTAPLPEPGPGQVVVESRRSLISTGTELAALIGPSWTNPDGRTHPQYPRRSGYSNAGVVTAVGDGAQRWRAGDRVASVARHGTHAVLGESDWTVAIPDGVTDEQATFGRLGSTVMNGCRWGAPALGEDVVIIGQGLLGQLLAQYVALAGARRVIAVDLAPERLALARRLGCVTHCVNPRETDPIAAVNDHTAGRGADVVFEVTGRTETFDLAFHLARRHGRVVALGSPRWAAPVDMQQLHMKALTLIGAQSSSHPQEGDEANRWSWTANGSLVMEWLREGRLRVDPLITDRFAGDDAPAAYQTLIEHRERHLGVLLRW
jgi:2-desacetyl-2-hydroxyethyl bacteriochlorophyllide A dehydrogenase